MRRHGHRFKNTDPDARLRRKSQRESCTQSYHCQAVVDGGASRFIVGPRVSPCASDTGQLEPDSHSMPAGLGQPTVALADCGFADQEVIQRPDLLARS